MSVMNSISESVAMNVNTQEIIELHWSSANARDWTTFGGLIAPELLYEAPQSRERIRSGEGYLDMFRTWPGNWKADIKQLVCQPGAAVSRIEFIVGHETMTGITFFELTPDGLICKVTDYWPETYEPQPRVTKYMERY
jgi:hypothetical protein